MLYHSVPICPDGIYQIFDTWCAVFFKNVNWLNWLNKLMGASQTGYAFIVKSPQLAKITLRHRTGPSTASTCDTDQNSGDTVQYNGDTAANMDFCGGCFVLIA
jgi:hypothetical protein